MLALLNHVKSSHIILRHSGLLHELLHHADHVPAIVPRRQPYAWDHRNQEPRDPPALLFRLDLRVAESEVLEAVAHREIRIRIGADGLRCGWGRLDGKHERAP
ncbi:hypothetical protein PsYK624_112070 [Phanerochaete sordida]|uniref:Uncharacterized protein n=1 Tax=Phanerochaete sordida TaxID=48140 RepID=A0A9P3GFE6_9APHY|nr:hypothetical protein PsYK624_112070 [Phanerochaete sordida]